MARTGDDGPGATGTDVGSEGTYDVDAEIRFSHLDLVVTPTAAAFPNLSFRLDVQSWTGHNSDQLFVTASGERFGGLEEALEEDATVAGRRLVAEFETERLYRVCVSERAKRLLPLFDGVDAVVRDTRCNRDGWTVRTHLSTRTVLTELTDRCGDAEISMEVARLSRMGSVDDPDGAVLSTDQRELLVTAIDNGYFETPRGITQHDLANMFDVSPSAISQRLRTATGKLVAHNLGSQ